MLYLVFCEYQTDCENCGEYTGTEKKFLGAFSSQEKAEKAVERIVDSYWKKFGHGLGEFDDPYNYKNVPYEPDTELDYYTCI